MEIPQLDPHVDVRKARICLWKVVWKGYPNPNIFHRNAWFFFHVFFLLPPGWQGSLFLPAGWGVGTSKFEVRGWILRLGFVDVFWRRWLRYPEVSKYICLLVAFRGRIFSWSIGNRFEPCGCWDRRREDLCDPWFGECWHFNPWFVWINIGITKPPALK